MKELSTILDEASRRRKNNEPYALATVAKINGSAYRQPGTRMLVTPEGDRYGTISGGCLEAEVAQRALQVLEDGTPLVEGFDLSDDDLILGFGIGCEGVVHVLIEPVDPDDPSPLALVETCRSRRSPAILATVIGAPDSQTLGQRLLALDAATTEGSLGLPAVETDIRDPAGALLDEGRTQIRTYEADDGPVEVLLEYLEPPVHLVVCGDGHDVRPVVRVARELGWQVTVAGTDSPDELAAGFPKATDHVFLMNPGEIADTVTLDALSPVVVMNHNFQRDKTLVGTLLQTDVPYVGALGPSYRTERIVNELQDDGTPLSDATLDRLHGPVGLDIGTETPQEIALAIVAEIQAELQDRSAQKLRERDAPIHERVPG